MINVENQIEALQALSTSLAAKAELLNSTLLSTDDDAISNLKEKLLQAVEALNEDIQNIQSSATNANNNKKW